MFIVSRERTRIWKEKEHEQKKDKDRSTAAFHLPLSTAWISFSFMFGLESVKQAIEAGINHSQIETWDSKIIWSTTKKIINERSKRRELRPGKLEIRTWQKRIRIWMPIAVEKRNFESFQDAERMMTEDNWFRSSKELDHENLETKDLKEEYLKELMLGTEDNKDKEKWRMDSCNDVLDTSKIRNPKHEKEKYLIWRTNNRSERKNCPSLKLLCFLVIQT